MVDSCETIADNGQPLASPDEDSFTFGYHLTFVKFSEDFYATTTTNLVDEILCTVKSTQALRN